MPGRIHPVSKNLRAYVSPTLGLEKDAATCCKADQSWAAGNYVPRTQGGQDILLVDGSQYSVL